MYAPLCAGDVRPPFLLSRSAGFFNSYYWLSLCAIGVHHVNCAQPRVCLPGFGPLTSRPHLSSSGIICPSRNPEEASRLVANDGPSCARHSGHPVDLTDTRKRTSMAPSFLSTRIVPLDYPISVEDISGCGQPATLPSEPDDETFQPAPPFVHCTRPLHLTNYLMVCASCRGVFLYVGLCAPCDR